MNRRTVILLVAAVLLVFGIWRLLNAIPFLFADDSFSLVPVALLIQGLLAVVTAVALFYGSAQAALLVIVLGLAVGITALFESFVWQVLAPLGGVLIFVVALVAALLFAHFLRGERAV